MLRQCMPSKASRYFDTADMLDSTSPTNFFIYRTARIILVPAVTDQFGQLTCVTTSTFYPSTLGMTQSPLLFTGINSNAENYFAGATASASAALSVVTDISLSTPYLATLSTTTTANELPNVSLPSGVVTQSKSTGLQGKRADPTSSIGGYDVSQSDYGYVDPFFINFLAQSPDYQKQYPQLAGCLPGGPSIDPGRRTANLVSTPTLELSLTTTTSTTDYVSGCFNTDSPLCAKAVAPVPTAVPEVAPTPAPSPKPAPQPAQSPPTPVASPQPPQSPPTPVAPPQPPQSPPAPIASPKAPQNPPPAPIQPPSPNYNPNDLSPTQLSQLLGALQPTPGANPPAPSPISPPPPTSLQPSLSPLIVASFTPSELTSAAAMPVPSSIAQTSVLPSQVLSPPPTSLETSLSPALSASVTPSESASSSATPVSTTSARTSAGVLQGEAVKSRGKPLWSFLSLSLGCGVLALI